MQAVGSVVVACFCRLSFRVCVFRLLAQTKSTTTPIAMFAALRFLVEVAKKRARKAKAPAAKKAAPKKRKAAKKTAKK